VTVKTSQSDVAKVLERGESELQRKNRTEAMGTEKMRDKDALRATWRRRRPTVGLGAERKEVGQRIHCNRGEPKPIHDHSRSRAEVGGSLPGED
jgi:hypothetical protein